MENIIMAVSITPRSVNSPEVQTVLAKYGCIISTRLGVHEISAEMCSEKGLVILHIHSDIDEAENLKTDLLKIDGISVKYMTL